MCRTGEKVEGFLRQRLIQGDRTAFWELWILYCDESLRRHCLFWMDGNRADAEDALSSASLKAWQALPDSMQSLTHVKSWLICLVRNHCVDIQRQRSSRNKCQQRLGAVSSVCKASVWPTQESPEELIVRQEVILGICRALEKLSPSLREAAHLRFVDGLSCHDIAIQLDLAPATVRKRLQYARRLLQKRLRVYQIAAKGCRN